MRIAFIVLITFLLSPISAQVIECSVVDSTFSDGPESHVSCTEINLTLEEFMALPDVNFKLAFHFIEDDNGDNFTCDENDPIVSQNWHLYAPNTVGLVVGEMNSRMDEGLRLNGSFEDMKINFSLAEGGDCGPGIFLYAQGDPIQHVPDAINIIFDHTSSGTLGGYTSYGSQNIFINNALEHFLNGGNPWWNLGRLINHEFGHTRNLRHTFFCGNPCNGIDIDSDAECCGSCVNQQSNGPGCWSCTDNLTMGYGSQLRFTECEFLEIWSYMINNPRPYQEFDLCETTSGASEIVYDLNSHEIWSNNKVFNKDLRIKDGTTIEIECSVLMGDGKRIIVEEGAKLIVNGGHLSNLCSEPWIGVQVYGGSPNYSVEIKNDALIENALSAISMFHHDGWLLGNGNANILIDNSTFDNCERVLSMGAFVPSFNSTIVNNSTFDGGKYGVINWNCTNVQITNNDFLNTANSCIVTEKGQFLIEGNTFNSGIADIHFASISPGFGSFFNNNDFNGSYTGIRAVGTSFGEHTIEDNQFQTGRFDVFMDGDNNFLLYENSITSDFGAVFVDNGNHFNEVHNNTIAGNFVGLMPLGNNPGYHFHNNCFSTSSYDNYIQGEIAEVQGGKNLGTNTNNGANNCFTHGGVLNHATGDISGNPDPFVYVEPAYNNLPNCLNAENAQPNVTRVFGNFAYQDPCSLTAGGVGSSQSNTPCNPERSIQATEASIDTLEAIISSIQNDQSLSEDERQSFSQFYKNCLKRVKWIWAEVMLRENNFQELRNEFLTDSISDDVILTVYSSYLYENKLDSAEGYLLSQTNTSSKLADFITIQSINLERMQSLGSFSATDSVLNIVETIALKRHAYSGYAKSLYFWLTEEIISTELPKNITDEEAIPRMSESEEIKSEIEVFPNPFKDHLFIRYPIGTTSDLLIMDILGNVLVNRSIEDDVKLNTSKWNSGLYMVLVNSKDELLFQGKFVLTR